MPEKMQFNGIREKKWQEDLMMMLLGLSLWQLNTFDKDSEVKSQDKRHMQRSTLQFPKVNILALSVSFWSVI